MNDEFSFKPERDGSIDIGLAGRKDARSCTTRRNWAAGGLQKEIVTMCLLMLDFQDCSRSLSLGKMEKMVQETRYGPSVTLHDDMIRPRANFRDMDKAEGARELVQPVPQILYNTETESFENFHSIPAWSDVGVEQLRDAGSESA